MRRSDFRGLLLCVLLAGFGSNCGVEVGNPHGGGGSGTGKPTGAVSLALADAPVDDAQHVYLTLKSMSVIPLAADGTSGTPTSVPLAASGKIDALALQNGKTLDLMTAEPLATGSYAGVILELDSADPASIVPRGGHEQPLPFAGKANRIVVSQQFTVADGTALSLVLHLDLRRSISGTGGNDAPFAFSPFASMHVPDQEVKITGTAEDPAATEVCAYLFRRTPDNDEGPLNHPGPPPGGGTFGGHDGDGHGGPGIPPVAGGAGGPPPNSVAAQPPPSFDPGQTFDPATDDATCAKAFATASVSGGAFSLEHLWPGHYQLVFYKADGTRVSATPTPVDLDAGQTSKVVGTATATATATSTSTATTTATATSTATGTSTGTATSTGT